MMEHIYISILKIEGREDHYKLNLLWIPIVIIIRCSHELHPQGTTFNLVEQNKEANQHCLQMNL